jgi:hypothetical protein
MRRTALIIGGFVSITAVAAFIYVMQGPIAFHPAQRKGHPSPIALVMEHLNHPVSDSLPSDAAPLAASVAAAPPDQNTNPAVSSRAISMASSQASVPSGQQRMIRIPASGATPSDIVIPATAAPTMAAGWNGSWGAVNGEADLPRWLSLTQESARLAIIIAPDSAAHYLLLHAQASGDSISFELQDGRRILRYALKAENNELHGAVSIATPAQTKTVAVRFERAQ